MQPLCVMQAARRQKHCPRPWPADPPQIGGSPLVYPYHGFQSKQAHHSQVDHTAHVVYSLVHHNSREPGVTAGHSLLYAFLLTGQPFTQIDALADALRHACITTGTCTSLYCKTPYHHPVHLKVTLYFHISQSYHNSR